MTKELLQECKDILGDGLFRHELAKKPHYKKLLGECETMKDVVKVLNWSHTNTYGYPLSLPSGKYMYWKFQDENNSKSTTLFKRKIKKSKNAPIEVKPKKKERIRKPKKPSLVGDYLRRHGIISGPTKKLKDIVKELMKNTAPDVADGLGMKSKQKIDEIVMYQLSLPEPNFHETTL